MGILFLCWIIQQSNIVSLKPYNVTVFPSKSSDPVDFIIITTDELKPAYETLKSWRIEKGINCDIKTVDWIAQNYPGADTPDRIRNFLKSAYTDWNTRYVLLGGDPSIVPTRNTQSKNQYFPFYTIASDLYYSALNGTWNADGDMTWAEAIIDSTNFTPLIWVSRLPGTTFEEANIVVTKVISYEKSPNINCLEKAMFLASKDESPYVRPIVNSFPDYFTKDTLWGASKSAITDSMAKGYGFLYGAFHGSSTQNWSNQGGGGISRPDIDNLTAPLYSIVTISCYTHWIEIDCMSRHFVLNPYASLSCLGSSRVGWFSEETRLNCYFYEAIFDSLFPIGKALAWAKAKIIPDVYLGGVETDGNYRDVVLSYDLYGDPCTRFWTKKPDSLIVSYPLTISTGEKKIKITVRKTKDRSLVSGASVCLYKKDEIYGRGITNSHGEVIFLTTPETRGNLKLVVSKPDFLPYEGYIFIQPDYAYVKYKNYTIDGDSFPESGETIKLSLSLENTGAITAFDVLAKIINSSPYLTLLDTTQSYGNLLTNEIKSKEYRINIDKSCPSGNINLSLNIYNSLDSSRDTFNLNIRAPLLTHFSHYADSSHLISLRIKNEGTGKAKTVTATLFSLTSGISLVDSLEYVGDILADTILTLKNCFQFSIDSGVSVTPQFTLEFTDSCSHIWNDTFTISSVNPPTILATFAKPNGISVNWNSTSAYGYNVYRASDTTLLNSRLIKNIFSFEDKFLSPYTSHSYFVTSVDNSLNESNFSSLVSGRSNPSFKSGWPQPGKAPFVNSPTVADLKPEKPGLEIIANMGDDQNLYAWYASGEGVLATNGTFVSNLGNSWTAPVVADIDKDGNFEIIRTQSWTNTPKIWAFTKDGAVRTNFPLQLINCEILFSSPSVHDLDKDGKLEIILAEEGLNTGNGRSGRIYVFRENGTGYLNTDGLFAICDTSMIVIDPYQAPALGICTPAIADINNDDTLEIILGFSNYKGDTSKPSLFAWNGITGHIVPGWPVFIKGIPSSPAIGNIDPSYPGLEVVIHTCAPNNFVYVFHSDGTPVTNWPKTCNSTSSYLYMSGPTIGDINGDGGLEIALAGVNSFCLWKGDGTTVTGWPVILSFMNQVSSATPILADIDGDNVINYIGVSLLDGTIYAFEPNGKITPGFPIYSNGRIDVTPLVSDIDFDGKNELISATRDCEIRIWGVAGTKIEWGTFCHDRWHTGTYGFVPSDTSIISVEEKQQPFCFKLLQNAPNPVREKTSIQYCIGEMTATVKLNIYDASGRLTKTLVDNNNVKPGNYTVRWEGSNNNGKKVASGIYFYKLETDNFKTTKKLVLIK
ncbi:MAG: C25 family cysteine peptidase [bacterium]|nr:C25 family cysteine peptidase [bacterium]